MLLPHDTNAERVILSGLLKDFAFVRPRCVGITEESFYWWHHRLVWRKLNALRSPGPYSLYLMVSRREWPDLPQWIGEVWELDPTGCWVEWATELVRQCETKRNIITRVNEVLRDVRSMSPDECSDLAKRLT